MKYLLIDDWRLPLREERTSDRDLGHRENTVGTGTLRFTPRLLAAVRRRVSGEVLRLPCLGPVGN